MAKVGTATKSVGPISTVFKDAVVPVPGQAGDWASVTGGADIPSGKKATPSEISEVTFVDLGPSPGTKVSARGKVANR